MNDISIVSQKQGNTTGQTSICLQQPLAALKKKNLPIITNATGKVGVYKISKTASQLG